MDARKKPVLISAGAMAITAGLLASAAKFEGSGPTTTTPAGEVVHHAYPDPGPKGWGLPTICNGRTRGVFKGMTATAGQCQLWLAQELQDEVLPDLAELVQVPVTQGQAEVVALFRDNVGRPQFAASMFLRRINAGDCMGAARELGAAPQLQQGGRPRIWTGPPLIDKQTGAVLLATGSPVMKWTTAAGVPLSGLIKRRAEERAKFEADCQYWEKKP